MYCKVTSGTVLGVGGMLIKVEADVSDGLPAFSMVGMLSSEVKEAGERVRTALKNSGFKLPPKRITVNLSPADIRKEGSAFDLPIALAVLANLGYIESTELKNVLVIGELGLNGDVNRVSGVLPIVCAAMEKGCALCIVPADNAKEAAVISDITVIGVRTLKEAIQTLVNPDGAAKAAFENAAGSRHTEALDFSEIAGQEAQKRAAEVAAAGMHNLLMIGPPGSGKTMVASRIPTLLPKPEFEESLEITKVYSVLGLLDNELPFISERPFRAPHHTITRSAMTGGGRRPLPGEISLADKGVLFLDELPEFEQSVLEVLRQPLEDGRIVISRVHGSCVFPADFMLVAAMNPCKCGYYPSDRCRCTGEQVRRYLGRISRPLLDRIDISVEVPKLEFSQLAEAPAGESSETMRKRVEAARERQTWRYRGSRYCCNGRLDGRGVREFCRPDREGMKLLEKAYKNLGLTARSYHKLLKVARTIADLEQSDSITRKHISEALLYRVNMGEEFWGGSIGREQRA